MSVRLLKVVSFSALALGGAVFVASCGRHGTKPSWDEVPVGNKDNLYPNNEDCYKCHTKWKKLTKTAIEHRQGIVGTCLVCHSNRGANYGRSKIDDCKSCHDMGDKYREIAGGALSCKDCHRPTGNKRHPGPVKTYLAYHVLKPSVYGHRPEVKVPLNKAMLDLSITCKTCHQSKEDKRRRAGRSEIKQYPSGCGHQDCHGKPLEPLP